MISLDQDTLSLKTIVGFEENEWGLYPRSKENEDLFIMPEMFDFGRERFSLTHNLKYSILPLIHNDSNFDIMKGVLSQMCMRASYFEFFEEDFSMIQKGVYHEPKIIHPLDSIILRENYLELIIEPLDYNKCNIKETPQDLRKSSIIINPKKISENLEFFINMFVTKEQVIEEEFRNIPNNVIC